MPDDVSFTAPAGRFGFERLEALLFDMDGTLSDTDPIHRQAMVETFAARGVGVSDEDFHRHVSGQSNDAIFARFFPALSEDERRRLADEKEALYRRLTARMTPMPGLKRLIGWAKARGVACALVTNGPRLNVAHTLEVLGLTDSFDALVLGEDLPRGPLHALLTRELDLKSDLDVCAYVYARSAPQRDRIAALSRLVARAAAQGDEVARRIFADAGRELAAIVEAVRQRLEYQPGETVNLSYSGGVFQGGELILQPFRQQLSLYSPDYRLISPRHGPAIGAALYAARLSGRRLRWPVDA